MKFFKAAAIVAAATISILPATAIPIASESLNATAPGTVSNTTTSTNITTTTISHPKTPSNYNDATNRPDMDTEGFPEGDWDNRRVSVVFHETARRVRVYNIDWAGDDGWMLRDELIASNCPFANWSYKWTGWDKARYEAWFDVGSLRYNMRCTYNSIKRALDVDRVEWHQGW